MYESGRRINSYGRLLSNTADQIVYEDDFIPEDEQTRWALEAGVSFEFLDANDGTVYEIYHDADEEARSTVTALSIDAKATAGVTDSRAEGEGFAAAAVAPSLQRMRVRQHLRVPCS